MPRSPEQGPREVSLDEGLQLWRNCLLQKSGSKAYLSGSFFSAKKFVSSTYYSWWDKVFRASLGDDVVPLPFSKTPAVAKAHGKGKVVDPVGTQEKDKEKAPSLKKRKTVIDVLDCSASSNHESSEDRNWKRQKSSKTPNPGGGDNDSSRQVDAAVAEALHDVLGAIASEGSRGSHVPTAPAKDVEALREASEAVEQIPPLEDVSHYDFESTFEDHCRIALEGHWGDIQKLLTKRSLDKISSIRAAVLKGIARAKRTLVMYDFSGIERCIDILFANAAAYDEAKSSSCETRESSARREKAVEKLLRDAEVEQKVVADGIASTKDEIAAVKREIAALDERKRALILSLEARTSQYSSVEGKVKACAERLEEARASFDEEAHRRLQSAKSLLEVALMSVQQFDPFAEQP